ncbi:hypothetical protein VTJ04DRAFT_4241 [Mycothermus thermophilus]|uniref:uncharacterized protein n=1 Tax=Humicola insolens TaxID=85995 RepID=UPI003743C41E
MQIHQHKDQRQVQMQPTHPDQPAPSLIPRPYIPSWQPLPPILSNSSIEPSVMFFQQTWNKPNNIST